jgi:hypothetical protein
MIMQESEIMSRYVASRWVMKKHLIFPQESFVEKFHVRTRKRRFPLFWILNEESIPLTKIASIKIHKGLFFSDIIIENSGGDYPIRIDGLTNKVARRFRDDLESRERDLRVDPPQRTPRRQNVTPQCIDYDDGFSTDDELELTVHSFEE